jgi:hypothetical protein
VNEDPADWDEIDLDDYDLEALQVALTTGLPLYRTVDAEGSLVLLGPNGVPVPRRRHLHLVHSDTITGGER